MSDDNRNAFERRQPQPSLADDRQNRFSRQREVVDEKRRDTTAHDNRVAKHAQDNARWLKKTFQPTAAGGTPLPDDLVALKAASDVSRTAPKQEPISINIGTLRAVITLWRLESPDGQ